MKIRRTSAEKPLEINSLDQIFTMDLLVFSKKSSIWYEIWFTYGIFESNVFILTRNGLGHGSRGRAQLHEKMKSSWEIDQILSDKSIRHNGLDINLYRFTNSSPAFAQKEEDKTKEDKMFNV